jgi:tyrosine decarboxylase/aspartate 1-decarboxylase
MPYLAGGNFRHINIVGTRSGAPVIAFWYILNYFGIKGFNEIIQGCMDNTMLLVDILKEIEGVNLATKPDMNIVGISPSEDINIMDLDKKLRSRGWMVATHPDFNLIRIVIMPHVQEEHLKHFCQDLKRILK